MKTRNDLAGLYTIVLILSHSCIFGLTRSSVAFFYFFFTSTVWRKTLVCLWFYFFFLFLFFDSLCIFRSLSAIQRDCIQPFVNLYGSCLRGDLESGLYFVIFCLFGLAYIT